MTKVQAVSYCYLFLGWFDKPLEKAFQLYFQDLNMEEANTMDCMS